MKVSTSFDNPQIKTNCASVTRFKSLIHKSFLVLQTNLDIMPFINWCRDGKFTHGLYFRINLLRNGDSTKDKGTNSLTMNNTKSSSN
jgi:hypothetical protein